MNNYLPEILAPAGSYEIMVQAFQAGADAVYLGGQAFGARAFASNLTEQELVRAIEYAQLHHKRIYLTVNTLLKDEEIDRLSVFLKAPYEAGLDGVIVQDLGVAGIIHEEFPDMELHASTQMTITSESGAKALKELGVVRVVPARELSIQEIQTIKQKTGLEVEVFVHGALCYSYSGQCLLSSMIGGRSGNRGRCAQPCRQLYTINGISTPAKYYLSPSDLCGLEAIPELIRIGVDSFKIEGRMKNAEYVISAVRAYREAVDVYEAYMNKADFSDWKKKAAIGQKKDELADIFNRGGFTDGYFHQNNSSSMMSMERNNHNGVYIGSVTGIHGGTVQIDLTKELNAGDVIEIRTAGGDIIELTASSKGQAGSSVTINGKELKKIRIRDAVYRTKNHRLCKEILERNKSNILKENIHISVMCKKDLPVKIEVGTESASVSVAGGIATQAISQPLAQEGLNEKLRKTGDTPFQVSSVSFQMDSDCFFSMKEFNQLRHQAMMQLEQTLISKNKRSFTQRDSYIPEKTIHPQAVTQTQPGYAVYVSSREQLEIILKILRKSILNITQLGLELTGFSGDELSDCVKLIHEMDNSIQIIVALPHIYRSKMYQDIADAISLPIDGVLVRTIDELAVVSEIRSPDERAYEIIADAGVYTYNRKAIDVLQDWMNLRHYTLPAEYDISALTSFVHRAQENAPVFDYVIYGKQMVMVTAQCTYQNTNHCTKNNTSEDIILKNRFGDEIFVEHVCRHCYNVLYLNTPTCLFEHEQELTNLGIRNYRIHFTNEKEMEIKKILSKQTPIKYVKGRFEKGIE